MTPYCEYLKIIIIVLNGSLNKFQDHGFICFVWIDFDKEDACQNEDSNKFFIELLNSNFAQPHSKNLCGFMVNMLIHFPWDCGFELAQVHMFTCMCNCVCAHINNFFENMNDTCLRWWMTHDYDCQLPNGHISY